jgi:hypothetical protein
MLLFCQHEPLELRRPAGVGDAVADHRSGGIIGKDGLDLPHDLLALADVGLGRLQVDQPVDLGIVVARLVAIRGRVVVLVRIDVGVIDADAGAIHAHG